MKLDLITSTVVTLEFLLYQTGGGILQEHAPGLGLGLKVHHGPQEDGGGTHTH